MEEQRLFKVVDPDACELGEDASHEKLGFKFGERYHAIVRKYGAVELIQDEEVCLSNSKKSKEYADLQNLIDGRGYGCRGAT